MEDIMLIRSSFMRRIISQIINKALKKQAPGVEVELKEAQVNWVDKEQKLRVHLELDAAAGDGVKLIRHVMDQQAVHAVLSAVGGNDGAFIGHCTVLGVGSRDAIGVLAAGDDSALVGHLNAAGIVAAKRHAETAVDDVNRAFVGDDGTFF